MERMFSLRAKFLALLAWLAQPERLKLRLFLEGNLIGVLTGLVVAAFRYLLVCSEEILPRRISGNCAKHQRQVTVAIKRARNIALLPFTAE